MKKKLFYGILISLLLCACKGYEPKLSTEELYKMLNEYALLISDNYETGDLIDFETENGDIQSFFVESCYKSA